MNPELIDAIHRNLSDDLLSTKWRKLRTEKATSGHCYIAAEALWHLLGGRDSGFTPHV